MNRPKKQRKSPNKIGHPHTVTRNGNPKECERNHKPDDTLIDFFNRAPFPEEDLDLTRDAT